jgi:hypothetical protein
MDVDKPMIGCRRRQGTQERVLLMEWAKQRRVRK